MLCLITNERSKREKAKLEKAQMSIRRAGFDTYRPAKTPETNMAGVISNIEAFSDGIMLVGRWWLSPLARIIRRYFVYEDLPVFYAVRIFGRYFIAANIKAADVLAHADGKRQNHGR